MRRWNLVTKIIAGLSLAVLIGIVLFTPHQTFAAATSTTTFDPLAAGAKYDVDVVYGSCENWNISCFFLVGLKRFTLAILLLFGKFYAILLNIAAEAVRLLIENGMSIINLPIVTAGFKLTQGLTNLLFVLAIIVMAFATIFQYEDYSAKRLMVNLIKGAVLVNFSFLIAGAFIDVSNVFTNYFLKDVTANNLGSAFNPQSLLTPADPTKFGIESNRDNKSYRCSPGTPNERIVYTNNPTKDCPGETAVEIKNNGNVSSGIETVSIGSSPDGTIRYRFNINEDANGWATWFKLIQAILLADLMTLILMIVMIALAIMILARNITLVILIIFMPLIWGVHVIPKLDEHWGKWWGKFFDQIVFLPTTTFIVFLAVTTTRVLATSGGLFGSQIIENILQMLILCGILIAAIKTGKKAGVVGAALAFGVGGFIARGALGVQKTAVSVGAQVTGAALEGKGKYNLLKFAKLGVIGKGVSKAGDLIGKTGNKSLETGKLQKPDIDPNKGIGFIAGLGDRSDKTGKIREAAGKYRSEHLKDMDADAIVKEVGHPHGGDGQAERIAMLQQLIDKKALGSKDISLDRITQLLSAAKGAGMNELYNSASRDVLASRIHEVNPGNKDSEVSEVIELLRTGKDDKRSSVEIVNAFINDLGADQLAKVKLSKVSDNGVKETIASKFAQSRATISKYLGNAAEDDIAALESEFKKSVDSAVLTKGGASIKFDALILEKAPDAKKIFDDALTAAGADEGKRRTVNQAQRSYEAYRRMNQTVGTP